MNFVLAGKVFNIQFSSRAMDFLAHWLGLMAKLVIYMICSYTNKK